MRVVRTHTFARILGKKGLHYVRRDNHPWRTCTFLKLILKTLLVPSPKTLSIRGHPQMVLKSQQYSTPIASCRLDGGKDNAKGKVRIRVRVWFGLKVRC